MNSSAGQEFNWGQSRCRHVSLHGEHILHPIIQAKNNEYAADQVAELKPTDTRIDEETPFRTSAKWSRCLSSPTVHV